jgi:hypothetical protein
MQAEEPFRKYEIKAPICLSSRYAIIIISAASCQGMSLALLLWTFLEEFQRL